MTKSSAAVSIATPNSDQFLRFEYVDEKSSKFWEIRANGSDTEVRYGKIGTSGQAQTKSFDSPETAQKSADKLVAEKIKGGYHQVGSTEVAEKTQSAITESVSSVKAKKPVATKALVQPDALQAVVKQADESSGAPKTVCISGKLLSGLRKADYETALQKINFKLVDDVVTGLSFLVLADPASTSAKADKARKLGVQVISEDQLISLTSEKWNGQ